MQVGLHYVAYRLAKKLCYTVALAVLMEYLNSLILPTFPQPAEALSKVNILTQIIVHSTWF